MNAKNVAICFVLSLLLWACAGSSKIPEAEENVANPLFNNSSEDLNVSDEPEDAASENEAYDFGDDESVQAELNKAAPNPAPNSVLPADNPILTNNAASSVNAATMANSTQAAPPAANAVNAENPVNALQPSAPAVTEPALDASASMDTKITWLGVDYQKNKGKVIVEILSVGEPKYSLREQKGEDGKSQIVIRYLNTKLPKRLRRGIDASEIMSPLAYVQALYDEPSQSTDIILTLRDAVRPNLFADYGNMLISFSIPDRYLGHSLGGDLPAYEATVVNPGSVLPNVLNGSQTPINAAANPPSATPKTGAIDFDKKAWYKKLAGAPARTIYAVAADVVEALQNQEKSMGTTEPQIPLGNPFSPNAQKAMEESAKMQAAPAQAAAETSAPKNAAPAPAVEAASTNKVVLEGEKTESPASDLAPAAVSEPASSEAALSSSQTSDQIGSPQPQTPEPFHFRPISLDFKGAPLKDVIRSLSNENGINFVFGSGIGDEKTDLTLRNVPWDQALQAVLETHSLGMMKLDGGVIRIDKLETLDSEKKNLEKVRKSASLLIPTKLLVVRLSYSQAKNVAAVIKDLLPSASYDSRVKVQSDERTNSVIIEAIPSDLEKIKTLIQRIDLQTPQVKIATRIIEVVDDDKVALGINWKTPQFDIAQGLGFGSLNFPGSIRPNFAVDTGIDPRSNLGKTSADFNIGSINNEALLAIRLRMSEEQSITKSLQNNSVIVADNEKAKIESGQEMFFSITNGLGNAQLTSVKFTLNLEVTPHITADGSVQMTIKVESATPIGDITKQQANKNLKTVETNLLRKSGETAVIGGLYNVDDNTTIVGTPLLSKLPIIGVLFRSKSNGRKRQELLIMVTPTILRGDNDPNLSQGASHSDTIGPNISQATKAQGINASNPNSAFTGSEASNTGNNNANYNNSNNNSGNYNNSNNNNSGNNVNNSQNNNANME